MLFRSVAYSPADATPTLTVTGGLTVNFTKTTENYYLTDIQPGHTYTFTLTVEKGGCTATSGPLTLEVANYEKNVKHDDITLCEHNTVQLNATLPSGWTGAWSGSGVAGSSDPAPTITAPSGDYFWTATNGTCSFQEQWTVVNNNPGFGEIAVAQGGDCGNATLSVSHNSGVTPVWKVDGVQVAADNVKDRKSVV